MLLGRARVPKHDVRQHGGPPCYNIVNIARRQALSYWLSCRLAVSVTLSVRGKAQRAGGRTV